MQVIRGSTDLPTGASTLQADGTRIIGLRVNADGTTTVVYLKIEQSQKPRVTLSPKEQFSNVPGAHHAQFVRGSTIL